MKITRKQLRQIIQEETRRLNENSPQAVPEATEISEWVGGVTTVPDGWQMAGSRDDNAFTPDFKGEALTVKYTKSFEGRNYTVTIKVDVS